MHALNTCTQGVGKHGFICYVLWLRINAGASEPGPSHEFAHNDDHVDDDEMMPSNGTRSLVITEALCSM